MRAEILDYYRSPGWFTHLDDATDLPRDVGGVVAAVQGMFVYDTCAQPFYGVDLTPAQVEAIHERDAAQLIAIARTLDARPITEARPPGRRIGGRCHTYSRMTVALLRAAGVPARARCGFGTHLRPGWFEDHWIAEVWTPDEGRWVMVDAQLDDTWRRNVGYAGDPMAITPTEFVTAGQAWQAWRRGELDADRCGLSAVGEHGAFWIAANLRLDLASLNKVEMLPWDVWGAGLEPGTEPTDELLELFDSVAALTVEPDDHFYDLLDRYDDDRLRMDGTVFNVLRGRVETVH